MKKGRRFIAAAAILVFMLTVPAFADDEGPADGAEEAAVSETARAEETAASETACAEEAWEGTAEEGPANAAVLVLVVKGNGTLTASEDGTVTCVPGSGWETVSLTADEDADKIRAGSQIPEEEISGMEFEGGTTISAVFERIEQDREQPGAPVSAAAIFG